MLTVQGEQPHQSAKIKLNLLQWKTNKVFMCCIGEKAWKSLKKPVYENDFEITLK